MKRVLFMLGLLMAMGAAGFVLGTQYPAAIPYLEKKEAQEFDAAALREAENILRERYLRPEDLDSQKLLWGALRGLVKEATDDYTTFFTPEEAKIFLEDTSGHFEGIGAEIGFRNGLLSIIAPLKDTPAEAAGLEAGDVILAIDGESTENITIEKAVSKIRGPAGTTVTLRISRNSKAPQEISVVRAQITISPAELRFENNIAIIELRSFSAESSASLQTIAQRIVGANASGLVLDLRNNPGGFLDQAVKTAGLFLLPNTPVVIEKRRGRADAIHRAQGPGLLADIPTAVIVNRGTASAAEILAGALRDARGIKIVGTETFGKGSVQEVVRLRHGAALKVTVGEWHTPRGTPLAEKGIMPDVIVERTSEGSDLQMERVLQFFNQ